jgi:hypothetical protein
VNETGVNSVGQEFNFLTNQKITLKGGGDAGNELLMT